LNVELLKTTLRAPVNITWEITHQCNLRCMHCLSDAGEPFAHELTTQECRDLVDQVAALRVFQVNFGGGEPFLREDFLGLLSYCHEKGLVTCVSTNGLLIDNRSAQTLSQLQKFYLQVSMDGATAETNDHIRGRGTFAGILTALDSLSRHGVCFSINTVLTRLNFSQLDTLRALAADYGAELRVSRFRPSGRGKSSREYLGPTKDQLEFFADWLNEHDLVRTGDSFFCLTSERRRRKGLDMCGAAKMTCCLSPVGDVFPCAFLQEKPFLAGNIRNIPFKKLWDRSSIFSMMRELEVKSCLTCLRFEECRGGCPAMAYHIFHNIALPDPECLVNIKATVARMEESEPWHCSFAL
jgi:mycofactocin biosynthetic radical S-adenosylmethionine protein MftC